MITALLAALALVLVPVPSPTRARLAAVFPVAAAAQRRRVEFSLPVRKAAPLAGACGAAAVVVAGLPVLVAASAGLVVAAIVIAVGRVRAGRVVAAEQGAMLEAVGTLAAELRAGQAPADALDAAALVSVGAPASVLAEAAATARLAGNVPAVLRDARGCAPGPAAALGRLAAAWQLSTTAGTHLAGTLDAAAQTIRAQRGHDRQVAALLAGPRATAALLAGLPLIGMALGIAVGADPLGVLLRSPAGEFTLLTGVILELAGLAWTDRIVRSAAGAR